MNDYECHSDGLRPAGDRERLQRQVVGAVFTGIALFLGSTNVPVPPPEMQKPLEGPLAPPPGLKNLPAQASFPQRGEPPPWRYQEGGTLKSGTLKLVTILRGRRDPLPRGRDELAEALADAFLHAGVNVLAQFQHLVDPMNGMLSTRTAQLFSRNGELIDLVEIVAKILSSHLGNSDRQEALDVESEAMLNLDPAMEETADHLYFRNEHFTRMDPKVVRMALVIVLSFTGKMPLVPEGMPAAPELGRLMIAVALEMLERGGASDDLREQWQEVLQRVMQTIDDNHGGPSTAGILHPGENTR